MGKLTKKQRGFIKDYKDTGNATESARRNYDVKNDNVAKSLGSENLAKPDIQRELSRMAEEAVSRIEVLSKKAKKEEVRLRANVDLADRGGLKAIERFEGDINFSWEKE